MTLQKDSTDTYKYMYNICGTTISLHLDRSFNENLFGVVKEIYHVMEGYLEK